MMSDQDESKRISLQVTSLSTQLIESVDKQSQLEEQLLVARKTISTQNSIVDSYNELKEQFEALKEDYRRDKARFEKQELICADAEKKVASLNQEIEDLTASLFDEANNMVSDARKEQNAVEMLNSRLKEQLKDKDLLLDTLSMQLKNLKNVLYKFENDHNSSKNVSLSDSAMSSTTSIDRSTTNQTSVYDSNVPYQGVLFSPLLHTLRYDVPLYTEYLKFLAVLPECETLQQTSSESKLIKRIINYEINPVLRLDNAPGIGWLTKRNLMNLMLDGLVSIEPISGINETYRAGYTSPNIAEPGNVTKDPHLFSRPINSPPVAMLEPCAFCGEDRNDTLEHGRLYIFKTYQKLENGKTEVINQYPVCHYCLLKLRAVCEIFALLRSLKAGAWNLEKVSLTSIHQGKVNDYLEVSKNIRPKLKSKRLSMFGAVKQPSVTPVIENAPQFADKNGLPTTNIQRSWARLSQLRAALQWAHIGVWSSEESVFTELAPVSESSKNTVSPEFGLGIASSAETDLPRTPQEDETFDFEAEKSGTTSVEDTYHLSDNDNKSVLTQDSPIETIIAEPTHLDSVINERNSIEPLQEPEPHAHSSDIESSGSSNELLDTYEDLPQEEETTDASAANIDKNIDEEVE